MFPKDLFKPTKRTKETFNIDGNAYIHKSLDSTQYESILSEFRQKYRHLDSHLSYIITPSTIDICIICKFNEPTLFMLIDTPIQYRQNEFFRRFIFRGTEFTVTSSEPNVALLKHIEY